MNIIRVYVLIFLLMLPNTKVENQKIIVDLQDIKEIVEMIEVDKIIIERLNSELPLEENEIVLDYRYIEGTLEVFSEIGDKYYRTTYLLKDDKTERVGREEIEMGKGGLKWVD